MPPIPAHAAPLRSQFISPLARPWMLARASSSFSSARERVSPASSALTLSISSYRSTDGGGPRPRSLSVSNAVPVPGGSEAVVGMRLHCRTLSSSSSSSSSHHVHTSERFRQTHQQQATSTTTESETQHVEQQERPPSKSILELDRELIERMRDRQGGYASISDADSMGPMTSKQMFRILDQVRDGHRYSTTVRAVSQSGPKSPNASTSTYEGLDKSKGGSSTS